MRLSVVLGLAVSLVAGAEARREEQVMDRLGRQLGSGAADDIEDDMINIKMLGISVPGVPGQDYPILATVPDTSFRFAMLSFLLSNLFPIQLRRQAG